MTADITVPHVGESIVDARIARWLKHAGDAVTAGEPIVELETDKIDVEVSAPQSGRLASVAHPDGSDVKVGEVIGTIEVGEAENAPANAPAGAPAEAPAGAAAALSEPAPAAAAPKPATPATQAPAQEDVPAADARIERVRMSKRRATIARRLVEAQHTAAMLTTFNEVDMSAVLALRTRQGPAFEKKHGVRLGLMSFFVHAAVAALQEFPRLNAEVQGDEMVLKHYYDIGIAVASPGGLVVPVLRNADRLSFQDIERALRAAKQKADEGTLAIDDLRGGTFTITNGGVFGSLLSTPILNAPEVAILGLHAILQRPVGVDGQVVLRPMMYLALTYDHRIVDGAEAVRFLVKIQTLIADPAVLLIEG